MNGSIYFGKYINCDLYNIIIINNNSINNYNNNVKININIMNGIRFR